MRFAMKRVKGNSFKLQEAIARAKSGKVFAGQIFYVTPKVQPDMQLLKHVIMSCGAQVRMPVRRQSGVLNSPLQCHTTTPTVLILDANANKHVISCPEDISIWRPVLIDCGQECHGHSHSYDA